MLRTLLCLITCSSILFTERAMAMPVVQGVSGTVDFGGGYRKDDLKFSIAGPTGTPDVLNEVQWEGLHIFQTDLRGTITAWDHVYLRGSTGWGWIMCGDVNDSYFGADGRTDELAHFNACIDNGTVFDISSGIGANIFPWRKGIVFAPLVGFSYHQQKLTIQDAIETIAPSPIFLGGIPGMMADYKATWRGPWLGFDFSFHPICDLRFSASYEYHWVCFRGKGDWTIYNPLTPGIFFVNEFVQCAHGVGQIGNVGLHYTFGQNWGFGFFVTTQRWSTSKGTNTTFKFLNTLPPANQLVGTFPITATTDLNHVIWHTFSVIFEADCEF